jgi:DNA-binding NarL/FixJ family response regulator
VATSILGVRPTVAVLHLDSVVADESIPIEELAAANVVTVVLTDRWDDARLGEFLRRGADVALSTSLGLSRLAHVITRAAAHQPAMESDELARLRDARRPAVDPDAEAARSACARLSTREGVILRSLMSGMSPVEIAHHDYVSAATVRTQVRSILSKLGVGSQLSAVALGFRAGWRPAEPEPPARVTHAV